MLSEREQNALLDILENIGHAEAFLGDATKDELATDTLRGDAGSGDNLRGVSPPA